MNPAIAENAAVIALPVTPFHSRLIVLGVDDRGRPHASRFDEIDGALVEKAASLMEMVTLPVEGDALTGFAAKLPGGKLFASGKAFVPFVGEELFQQLVAYLPVAQHSALSARRAAGKKASEQPAPKGDKEKPKNDYAKAKATGRPRGDYPEGWDKIKVGSIVLATDDRDEGWWTAHVRELRDDGGFLLEWEEWKGYAKFIRRREQIGLLHPDYDGK